MNACKLGSACLLSLAVVGFAGCGNKETGGGGGGDNKVYKSASSPEEALQYLYEYARAGDVDGFYSQIVEGSRDAEMAQMAADDARVAWQAALDEQFGKGNDPNSRKSAREQGKEHLKKHKGFEIVKQEKLSDDQVLLTTNATLTTGTPFPMYYLAVKESGVWKVLPIGPGNKPEMEPERWKVLKEFYDKRKETYEKETRLVKDKKYDSRQKAEAAIPAVYQ